MVSPAWTRITYNPEGREATSSIPSVTFSRKAIVPSMAMIVTMLLDVDSSDATSRTRSVPGFGYIARGCIRSISREAESI